jgi:hypothetical protein
MRLSLGPLLDFISSQEKSARIEVNQIQGLLATPIFLRLTCDCWRSRIFDLEPMRRTPVAIRRAEPRHRRRRSWREWGRASPSIRNEGAGSVVIAVAASANRAVKSLPWRVMSRTPAPSRRASPSPFDTAFSEGSGSLSVLPGSSPITFTSPSSKAHQKSGPFAPPTLPGLNEK